MPIARQLDAATGVLRTTISGTVSMDDLREHFDVVRGMGAASKPEIIDARHVSGLRFGARDLPKLAEYGREVFAGAEMAPRAFVVEGMVYFGIARLFATLASGWVQISVFDSMTPAESWLLQFLVH
jgi:hypothetical protein